VTYRRIPESHIVGHEGAPGRLGRHVNHDPRSLAYQVRADVVLRTVLWPRHIDVLDQGDLGSCTGNAATGALGTDPLWDALQTPQRIKLDETEAVALYSAATALDPYAGTYPPTDTGSDGVSVAKATQKAGLISGYLHATSIAAMNTALQTGPVIVGVNWYEGFDSPDSTGLVKISGSVRGGHEFEVLGYDVLTDTYTAVNSWGAGWGVLGRFRFTGATMTRLLAEDGDCTQLLPLSASPPVPTPTPPPPVVPWWQQLLEWLFGWLR
jgi:hypothetical protein